MHVTALQLMGFLLEPYILELFSNIMMSACILGIQGEYADMRVLLCRKPQNMDTVSPSLPPGMHLRVAQQEADMSDLWSTYVI